MRGRITPLLLSWPLLLSLAALIANDLYFKYAATGLLTGKLSDFAGIFLVAYLAYGLWPRRRLTSTLTIVALFVYWKSPLSQPLINMINVVSPFRFGRVVDYWDLLAFAIMPLALVAERQLPAASNRSAPRRLAAVSVATVTLVATTGTSVILPTQAFQIRNADPAYTMDPVEMSAVIERVAGNYGAECTSGAETKTPSMECAGPDLWLLYIMDERSGTAQFLVQSTRLKGLAKMKPDPKLLDRVLQDFKTEFARVAPNMEYVEPLHEDPHQQFDEFMQSMCDEHPGC